MAIFSMTRQCQKKKLQITLANINETPCLLPRICLQAQQKNEHPASWRTLRCFI